MKTKDLEGIVVFREDYTFNEYGNQTSVYTHTTNGIWQAKDIPSLKEAVMNKHPKVTSVFVDCVNGERK